MKKFAVLFVLIAVSIYGLKAQFPWTQNGTNIYYNGGNVGVGTDIPGQVLSVRKDQAGYTYIASDNAYTPAVGVGSGFAITEGNSMAWYLRGERDGTGKFNIGDPSGNKLTIDSYGNVGIGTINPLYKLAVKGTIGCGEVKVEVMSGWSDFVFHPTYKLRTLAEVEQFIKTNNHLPEIPTESEVKENGVNLSEMNAKLLQKIEELTLYLIEQNKRMEQQMKNMNDQQQEINELKQEVKVLKSK